MGILPSTYYLFWRLHLSRGAAPFGAQNSPPLRWRIENMSTWSWPSCAEKSTGKVRASRKGNTCILLPNFSRGAEKQKKVKWLPRGAELSFEKSNRPRGKYSHFLPNNKRVVETLHPTPDVAAAMRSLVVLLTLSAVVAFYVSLNKGSLSPPPPPVLRLSLIS